MEQESILNRFLVEIFHELLRREDEAIAAGGYPELSSREMDVIKTVCAASDQENSSREIAQRLRITAGTLSAAAKALERKGYLRRRRGPSGQAHCASGSHGRWPPGQRLP